MNKPHKWAKEITHFVNGGAVERAAITVRHVRNPWYSVQSLVEFDEPEVKFRIKQAESIAFQYRDECVAKGMEAFYKALL